MLLTNHTLTGIVLGLTIDNPVALGPAAVASHLLLDMTPHFWFRKTPHDRGFREPKFLVFGTLDFIVSLTLVAAICILRPDRTINIIIGAVGAALPDLTYIPIIVFGQRLIYKIPGYRTMIAFLSHIQWYEKPLGLITEVIWASLMLWFLNGQLS